jgi:sugar (pentulose or hexulose) kinase
LKDLPDARRVIANSFDLKHYQPADEAAWKQALAQYRRIYPKLK